MPSPPARPNSPSLSPAAMLDIERARAAMAKAREAIDARSRIPSAYRANNPPESRVARSLIGAATHPEPAPPRRPREKENRRLDPVSAARQDMAAFNDEVARGNTESFVQSVVRQGRRLEHERSGRCGPIHHRSLHDLLDDDEELLAEAEARARKRAMIPLPSRRRRRNRKQKPLARDFSGVRRQVLVLAKIHLFAFALAEGIYQTRLTVMEWAEEIHYHTWMMLLPKVKYEAPSQAEIEIMVNYLATLRGKVKDRLRPLAAFIHKFQHCVETQQDIQDNLDIFNLVYPNSFHCTQYSPREGHYESPHLARFIAAALFYAPSSVGVQFPDYFKRMPLTIVAFVLAVWQFCLEEWSNGWYESRDLGASFMLDKYEAHLAGLKDLEEVAPERMEELRKQWAKYAQAYSGASFVRRRGGQAATLRSELRPDTPQPERVAHERDVNLDLENLDLEELDQRLIEAAHLASLKHNADKRGRSSNSRAPLAGRSSDRAATQHSDLRAGSRRPKRTACERDMDVDYEDFDPQELEAARLASLEQRAARGGFLLDSRARSPIDDDDPYDEMPHIAHLRSPTPPAPLEYNEYGYATARSKGKGRAR
ncbi:hypothetical protein FS749_012356 [Ceratobasidium sp. UAMH 11750]|nr:hypothetical protein FS749_012356 [Ceratobasidium sp. UAMH 11750]